MRKIFCPYVKTCASKKVRRVKESQLLETQDDDAGYKKRGREQAAVARADEKYGALKVFLCVSISTKKKKHCSQSNRSDSTSTANEKL